MLNETLGKLELLAHVHRLQPRLFPDAHHRPARYAAADLHVSAGYRLGVPNLISTIGAFILALGILVFVINVVFSLRRGAVAGPNPWDAPTLEWAMPSPPPPYNFAVIPSVASRHPLWEERLGEGDGKNLLSIAALVLDHHHETLGVTPLDGEPDVILKMPSESYMPLRHDAVLAALFAGLLVHIWALAGAAAALGLVAGIAWLWPLEEAGERAI